MYVGAKLVTSLLVLQAEPGVNPAMNSEAPTNNTGIFSREHHARNLER